MVGIVKKPNRDLWRCEIEILVREGSLTDRALGSKAHENGHELWLDEGGRREAIKAREEMPGVLRGILDKVTSRAVARSPSKAISFDLSDLTGASERSARAVAYHVEASLTLGEMGRLMRLVPEILFDDEALASGASRPEVFGVTVHRLKHMKQELAAD